MSYLKVCVRRSSSSGNCTAIWTQRSAILIDCAGLSLKEAEKDLKSIKLDPSRITTGYRSINILIHTKSLKNDTGSKLIN